MRTLPIVLICAVAGFGQPTRSETKTSLPMPVARLIATVHANGAQIYECRLSELNTLIWQFREPIASLQVGSQTVGRHFAGPNWEMTDGTSVKAVALSQAPAASDGDIPHLMLTVTGAKGGGAIAHARTILRINTRGGVAKGSCPRIGDVLSVPYSADYAFYGASAED